MADVDALVLALRQAGCVFAEEEAALLRAEATGAGELSAMTQARLAGQPLEHVLGWVEFCGLRIAVTPGVFVPRRRSRLLVQQAVSALSGRQLLLDLCCGSGAVGVAVLAGRPDIELHASDIDPVAVACARGNLLGRGTVHQGDLFQALPVELLGRVDVVVANAPYVPTDGLGLLPHEAREHEPLVALDGGHDGLEVARRILADVHPWLSPRGRLVIETGRDQVADLLRSAGSHGLAARAEHCVELEATAVVAMRLGGP